MNRRQAILGAGTVVAAAAGLLGSTWRRSQAEEPAIRDPRLPRPISEMAFKLTDHEGRTVEPSDLVGKAALVFFGFTSCPDICPTTLANVAVWLDELGAAAERLTPVFISLDPERDTSEALSEYVAAFHPAIRGWTGTPEQVAEAAEEFRVTFRRVPLEGGGYTMDHTATVFLFGTDGGFSTAIDIHEPPEFAVPKIKRTISR